MMMAFLTVTRVLYLCPKYLRRLINTLASGGG